MRTILPYIFGFFAPIIVLASFAAVVTGVSWMFEWYVESGLSQPDAWRGVGLLIATGVIGIVILTKALS